MGRARGLDDRYHSQGLHSGTEVFEEQNRKRYEGGGDGQEGHVI